MSLPRLLLAGVVAGLALFFWMCIAHVVTGIAAVGVSELPNESAVIAALADTKPAAGFYYFPGMGIPPNATAEQKKAAEAGYGERYAKSPSGILVYTPPTGKTNPMAPEQLLSELGLELLEALIVVWVLSGMRVRTVAACVATATAIGCVVGITTNGSYLVWYNFPANYTAVQVFSQVVGFALVGLVGARFVREKPAQA